AAEADVTCAAEEPVDGEFEPEEEEEEDDPQLGDEGRDLGRLDQARHVRLVRSEQQPGEQVGGYRGEPEAPGDKTEGGEQRDRQGKLRERHESVILRGPWLWRCERPASAAAPASARTATPRSVATSARSAPTAARRSSTSAPIAAASSSRGRGAWTRPSRSRGP